jgi:hypothetical protein
VLKDLSRRNIDIRVSSSRRSFSRTSSGGCCLLRNYPPCLCRTLTKSGRSIAACILGCELSYLGGVTKSLISSVVPLITSHMKSSAVSLITSVVTLMSSATDFVVCLHQAFVHVVIKNFFRCWRVRSWLSSQSTIPVDLINK